jgi:hypothetical protein
VVELKKVPVKKKTKDSIKMIVIQS